MGSDLRLKEFEASSLSVRRRTVESANVGADVLVFRSSRVRRPHVQLRKLFHRKCEFAGFRQRDDSMRTRQFPGLALRIDAPLRNTLHRPRVIQSLPEGDVGQIQDIRRPLTLIQADGERVVT